MKAKDILVYAFSFSMIVISATLYLQAQKIKDKDKGLPLTKADCIETCIRVLQTEQLFPDYHRTVQKCNDLFAEVENCRLAK